MKIYENPLCERYASEEMKYIFSPYNKFSTWRKLWFVLAKSQKKIRFGKYNRRAVKRFRRKYI